MDHNILNVRHICPMLSVDNLSSSKDGKSGWRLERNGDYTCTYCDSIHPEQFISFLDTVITDPSLFICAELNGNNGELVINRPGIKVAGEGSIKFYLPHLKVFCDEQNLDFEAMGRKVQRALETSEQKWEKYFKENW